MAKKTGKKFVEGPLIIKNLRKKYFMVIRSVYLNIVPYNSKKFVTRQLYNKQSKHFQKDDLKNTCGVFVPLYRH